MSPEPAYVPFTEDAAELVASWATTPDDARFWVSATVSPVSAETVAAWGRADDVLPRMLVVDGRPVAYGELWIDDEEREVELARLIVDAKLRGQRLGRTLVGHLTREARGHYPDVFLRLQPDNAAAEACYRAAGFVRVDAEAEREWNVGQPSEYKWMRSGT